MARSSQDVMGVETRPVMSRLAPDPELPFRLHGTATLASQRFSPGFPAASDFGGRCATPSHLLLTFTMEAEASALGTLTGEFEHCTRIDSQTGRSTLADGEATMTAANGDELHARYSAADAPEGAFDEHLRFQGGTGRFADAGGEALAAARCDPSTGTCLYEARGTVVYHASSRAPH